MTDLSPIAFAVNTGSDWVRATRFANLLLRTGHRVLLTMDSLRSTDSATERGTFVIPLSGEHDPGLHYPTAADDVRALAAAAGVELQPLDGTTRLIAAPLTSVKIGLYGGGGAPFNQASILAECGFAVRFLSDVKIRAGALDEVDVLVVPGGGFRAMQGQLEPLGEEGCRAIAGFVRRGGMYIGSCAGSYDCAITPDDFLRLCPVQRHLQIINARVWNDASVEFGGIQSPGVGVITVRNEQPDHPVMFGLPASFAIVHYNGPIFETLGAPVVEGASAAIGLAAVTGWTDRFTPAEAFAGPIADDAPTLLKRAIEEGRFAAVAGELGRGRVVAFGSHPEFGSDVPMARWGEPARLLANAVLWQAASQTAGATAPPARWSAPGRLSFPAGSACDEVVTAAAAVRHRAAEVRARTIAPPPAWLTPDYALALFGLTPADIWRQSLAEIDAMANEVGDRAATLRERIRAKLMPRDGEAGDPTIGAAVAQVERWLLDERPAEWRQDGGYQGVVALLDTAARMCEEAVERWDSDLGPPAGAYAYLHENPYHLVAGSYLAAVGCVAGALQLMRVAAAELDMAEHAADARQRDRQAGWKGVPERAPALA